MASFFQESSGGQFNNNNFVNAGRNVIKTEFNGNTQAAQAFQMNGSTNNVQVNNHLLLIVMNQKVEIGAVLI